MVVGFWWRITAGGLLVLACSGVATMDGASGTGATSSDPAQGSGGSAAAGSTGTDPNIVEPSNDVSDARGGMDSSSVGGESTGAVAAASAGMQAGTPPALRPDAGEGCGKPLPVGHAVSTVGTRDGYQEYHVMQTGANLLDVDPNDAVDRLFWVRVPPDYDPNRPYRVVYLLQGCGGGDGRDNVYPLFNEAQGGEEDRIYVAVALPPNEPNGLPCYDHENGEESMEWEAFELFHSVVTSTYCVDPDHVYVAGNSTGALVAIMWGCYFAGVDPTREFAPRFSIRGQMGVAGGFPPLPACGGPVAGLWVHELVDDTAALQDDYGALERVLEVDGCTGSATEPWGDADLAELCEQYVDCPVDYPVVFCTTMHYPQSGQDARAIPAFTQFISQIEP